MKTRPLLLILVGLAQVASAVTHAVLPGETIQAKVDIAQPGDIIAIFGGTYPGDVTINKAVRLVEVDGQEVTITGNVTWSGLTDAPPFEGFTVGSAGKKITVINGTNVVFKGVDTRAGDRMLVQGGATNVDILNSQIRGVDQEGGTVIIQNSIISQNVTSNIACKKTFLIRSKVQALSSSLGSEKVYIAYSEIGGLTYNAINGTIRVIGSKFDGQISTVDNLLISGTGCDVLVANSSFINTVWGKWNNSPEHYGRGINIGISNKSRIFNNHVYTSIIENNTAHATIDFAGGDGIRVADTNSVIQNNIIWGIPNWAITAPFGALVTNNCLWGYWRGGSRGGFIPEATFVSTPGVVDISSNPVSLQPTSPCVNTGSPNPVFNDLDGTRNDVGPGGGCLFDPEGWTTDKPVVISFDLAPQQLLKGVDTQVTISNGQAVGQP